MNPSINSTGDIVLVDKLTPRIDRYLYRYWKNSGDISDTTALRFMARIAVFLNLTLRSGDIVVCSSPTENYLVCKRLVAKGPNVVVVPTDVWEEQEDVDVVTMVRVTKPQAIRSEIPLVYADDDARAGADSPAGDDDGCDETDSGWWVEKSCDRVESSRRVVTTVAEVVVPTGRVWLQGDNLHNSTDSRVYGPVPHGLIRGRVLCRIWPFDGRPLRLPPAMDPPYLDPTEPIRQVRRTVVKYGDDALSQ